MKRKFELMVNREDVNSALGFVEGLVLNSECPSLAMVAVLMEASELAILACKDDWRFLENKEATLEELRNTAKHYAVKLYHNGGDDNGSSQTFG